MMLEIKKPQAVNPYIAGRALSQDRGFFGRVKDSLGI